jgi:hypothetical protein
MPYYFDDDDELDRLTRLRRAEQGSTGQPSGQRTFAGVSGGIGAAPPPVSGGMRSVVPRRASAETMVERPPQADPRLMKADTDPALSTPIDPRAMKADTDPSLTRAVPTALSGPDPQPPLPPSTAPEIPLSSYQFNAPVGGAPRPRRAARPALGPAVEPGRLESAQPTAPAPDGPRGPVPEWANDPSTGGFINPAYHLAEEYPAYAAADSQAKEDSLVRSEIETDRLEREAAEQEALRDKPSIWRRIGRSVAGLGVGFVRGGLRGAAEGAIYSAKAGRPDGDNTLGRYGDHLEDERAAYDLRREAALQEPGLKSAKAEAEIRKLEAEAGYNQRRGLESAASAGEVARKRAQEDVQNRIELGMPVPDELHQAAYGTPSPYGETDYRRDRKPWLTEGEDASGPGFFRITEDGTPTRVPGVAPLKKAGKAAPKEPQSARLRRVEAEVSKLYAGMSPDTFIDNPEIDANRAEYVEAARQAYDSSRRYAEDPTFDQLTPAQQKRYISAAAQEVGGGKVRLRDTTGFKKEVARRLHEEEERDRLRGGAGDDELSVFQ